MLFNDAILWIRHLAFLQAPVQSVAWGVWARQLSLQSSLLVTALPPTVGGLTVGLLRYLSGKGIIGSAFAVRIIVMRGGSACTPTEAATWPPPKTCCPQALQVRILHKSQTELSIHTCMHSISDHMLPI